jgi:hypothetical protein
MKSSKVTSAGLSTSKLSKDNENPVVQTSVVNSYTDAVTGSNKTAEVNNDIHNTQEVNDDDISMKPSQSPPAPLFGVIDVPAQFYSFNHGLAKPNMISRLTAPATYAQWSQVIAVLAAIALFILLLFNNINTPQTSISATLLDGWTCNQITPLSRYSSEVKSADFCGYTNTAASSNMIIVPYSVFKGRTEVDPYYTSTFNCPNGEQTPSASQKVYAFRDSYFWSGQQYDSYDQCMNTLTTMCNAHTTTTFQTNSTMLPADAASVNKPVFSNGNIISNAQGQNGAYGWYNRNWFMFNGSSCATPCGTTNSDQYIYPVTKTGWKVTQISTSKLTMFFRFFKVSADASKIVGVVQNFGTLFQMYVSNDSGASWTATESLRYWTAIALSSDGTKIAAVVSYGQIYTSIDSGANWTARESSRVWSSIAMSSDGTKMAATVTNGQIYTSIDSGANWTARESSRGWSSIVMSSDGTKMAAVVSGGQIYTSIDSGANWTARSLVQNWSSFAMSSDGSALILTDACCSSTYGRIYLSTDFAVSWSAITSLTSNSCVGFSAAGKTIVVASNGEPVYFLTEMTSPASKSYNLPAISYDENISIGTMGVSPLCSPATPTLNNFLPYSQSLQYCAVPASVLTSLPINKAWQQAVPSVNKATSTGEWQFGSWGFCLDSPKYATCDAQFKGEVCNSGFFKAMLGDTICGKYKKNGPYYCTKQPDYFSAISLAATTALSVIGVVVTICAIVLGKVFGDDYDGNVKCKEQTVTVKSTQNCDSIEMTSSKHAHVL